MKIPKFNRQDTSEIYAMILQKLSERFPELEFQYHLLLPDWNTYIRGETLSNHIVECMKDIQTTYGTLKNAFIFKYKCELTFDFHGVLAKLVIDYRDSTGSFTDKFLESFECVVSSHEFTNLYWEDGGGGMNIGRPRHYKICKKCLHHPVSFFKNPLKNMTSRFRNHFEGTV